MVKHKISWRNAGEIPPGFLQEILQLIMEKNEKCVLSLQALYTVSATAEIWYMSLVMRKPAFCICENKDADQLRGNREADQRLCFRYTDRTIPLLSKSEISSL